MTDDSDIPLGEITGIPSEDQRSYKNLMVVYEVPVGWETESGHLDDIEVYGTKLSQAVLDFDGDGKTDPAKFDSGTGIMSWLTSGTGTWGSADMGSGSYQIAN